MELLFESTKMFEKDMQKIEHKKELIKKINTSLCLLKTKEMHISPSQFKKCQIKLKNGLTSSLYTMKIDKDYRIILSIENDPLFNKRIITLYAITKPDNYNKVFSKIAESLYQNDFIGGYNG